MYNPIDWCFLFVRQLEYRLCYLIWSQWCDMSIEAAQITGNSTNSTACSCYQWRNHEIITCEGHPSVSPSQRDSNVECLLCLDIIMSMGQCKKDVTSLHLSYTNLLMYIAVYDMSWCKLSKYRQVSNIRRTWVGNEIVHHSDVIGASPVGAAPTPSSFSTEYLASIYCVKTTASRVEKHLSFGIWCFLY